MPEIVWEEPPASALGPRKGVRPYAWFAEELRKHKGKWAVWPGEPGNVGAARSVAGNIRRGQVAGFEPGEYEAAVDGTKVWARWVGPGGGQSTVVGIRSARSASSPEAVAENAAVRQWAREQGLTVAAHGRLPAEIITAYRKAKRQRSG